MPGSWIVAALAVVAGFFIGAVNPASIIARVRQADLREGSGNPGATNAGRVLGVRWGVMVGILDVLKGFIPTMLALWWLNRPTAYGVGLACVLGHVLSPYLRGRGGKGVATSFGAIIAVFPWCALASAVVFGLIVWRTRWVAGASLTAVAMLAVYSVVWPLPEPVAAGRVWGLTLAMLVAARHQGNIRAWLSRRLS